MSPTKSWRQSADSYRYQIDENSGYSILPVDDNFLLNRCTLTSVGIQQKNRQDPPSTEKRCRGTPALAR